MSDDLIGRLGRELRAAAERQAAAGAGGTAAEGDGGGASGDAQGAAGAGGLAGAGGRRAGRRRRGRRGHGALVVAGAVALAGAGAAAGLLGPRGEVGGPPSLTYARLSPAQIAGGVEQRSRPVVIGRGQLPESGWRWQLVAFQTTRGLCIAIDFPEIENIGGGCGTNLPRDGRAIDWQGHLTRLGRSRPVVLLGAVTRRAADVRVTHGYRARRAVERARIVRVSDPDVLAHIGVRQAFSYYVAEIGGDVILQKAVALDASGRRLGAAGVPGGAAGVAGFRFPEERCEARPPDPEARDVALPLPPSMQRAFAVLRRPQRAADRPPDLVRALTAGHRGLLFLSEVDVGALRRVGQTGDGRPLYLVVSRRSFPERLHHCLRTTTPRLRQVEGSNQRAARRAAAIVHLSLVDGSGWEVATGFAGADDDLRHRGGYGARGSRETGSRVAALIPDGVASIELTFRGGVRRVATVRDNHFAVHVPLGAAAAAGRVGQVWRDADGRVLHRQSPPR